ncbi:MAG TPA: acetyltransferase, partial [Flavobacteriaceae bacterium]|nr:acetyltransferase [Flavobacteriaceae bacterium]
MYLFGASGHGKVIAEIAEENNILIEAFIDRDQSMNKVLDYKVIHEIPTKQIDVVISIGHNITRKKLVNNNVQFNYPTLIHPKTYISKRSKIAEGTVVMSG